MKQSSALRRVLELKIVLILAMAGLAGACQPSSTASPSPTASPAASLVSVQVLPTQAANELMRISGVGGPYTSAPLQITDETDIRAHWEQSSSGEFSFGLVRQEDPPEAALDSLVMFEFIVGPSSGSGDFPFATGDYAVQVVSADGPWLIWIETISGE